MQEPRFGVQETAQKAVAEVITALAACTENTEARAEMAANPVLYEEPAQSVSIAVYKVGVRDRRRPARPRRKRRRSKARRNPMCTRR